MLSAARTDTHTRHDLQIARLENQNGSCREVRFNIREHPHLDHWYAVTSQSSQGQTAERVLIHVDIEKSELLVNNRFAYVSVSRAQHVAHICTNDRSKLPRSLSRESSQPTATEVEQELARRGPNRLASEGNGPPRRSKVTVSE